MSDAAAPGSEPDSPGPAAPPPAIPAFGRRSQTSRVARPRATGPLRAYDEDEADELPDPRPDPRPGSQARAPQTSAQPQPSPQTGRYLREGIVAALRQPFLRSLLRVPLKKVAIWASFLGLLYALREFFGLIFLTFVISYISAAIVERISPHFTNRKVPVVLVFAAIIGAVAALGVATVPRAVQQGQHQLDKLRKIRDPKAFFERWLAHKLGAEPAPAQVAHGEALQPGPSEGVGAVGSALAAMPVATPTPAPSPAAGGAASKAEDAQEEVGLLVRIGRSLNDPEINRAAAETLSKAAQEYLIPNLKSLVTGIYGGVAYFIVALIFSFMIVWDLPRLAKGVEHMERSRLGDVWVEVAPSIATFFRLLGKAFEAQTMIALVNTAITALGMWFLDIPGVGFLAMIVFVCSFIPIVGMFISTIPICVVALQVEGGGAGLVLAVLVMIMVAHMIEAYLLNPRIYGFHMKLHPLAVLIVLYLGQHIFGVWGLVIGVPTATYVWRFLILGEEDPAGQDPAPALAPA